MQNYSTSPSKIFPIIDCGNFILREKCETDIEEFFAYYSDREVNKFILCEIPQDLESARRELNYWRDVFYRNDGIYFAIADKESGKMIGSIGLTGYNSYQSRIEISYDLSKKYWRRGIVSKAIEVVVKYAFENFYYGRINRIEASVASYNYPSQNLLLKSGFVLEGILRQHRYYLGSYVDVCFFSMLRSDFIARQNLI
jgi:[ribosomal protein S5]-alanine N-acetyltransferase